MSEFQNVRILVDHLADPSQFRSGLQIEVVDEPGPGGANHAYRVSGIDWSTNPSVPSYWTKSEVTIAFQNGPIPQNGTNGLTHEVLLVIVADRLRSFQAGPYPCEENAIALDHVMTALNVLHDRTRDRLRRQVEGKMVV